MNREDYRKAFDELSFSADFQERTADLLQQRARELEKERNSMTFGKTKKMAVLIAACIALLAVSVSAAVMMLSPSDVANEHQMPTLAEAFQSGDAIQINETVESGGYAITLMGLVSGENLRDYAGYDPPVEGARTYAVLCLRSLDGAPLTNQTYDFSRYTLTPLVAGCSPAGVNDWTLNGGASGFAKDGLYYYLLDTRSIEIFADRTVYLAFYEGGVPNNTIFYVNDDGTIQFCDDFTGVHALFTLPLDPSKADPAAVEKFLAENTMGWTNDRTPLDEKYAVLEDALDGSHITIVPTVPETGKPYTADDFERDLALRREAWTNMLEKGQRTQADYDEWNQRQEEILSGLRDGSLSGLEGTRGDHYFYDAAEDGSSLPDQLTGNAPDYATEDEFKAYMDASIQAMRKKLEDGTLSQANYDMSVQELEQILKDIQDGKQIAVLQPDGGMFTGTAPGDYIDYQLDEDGNTVGIIQNIP